MAIEYPENPNYVVVDDISERNVLWHEGTICYVRNIDTLYILESGFWVAINGGGGGNTGYLSAGTTNASLGQVVFSNLNGVTFGLNGQTMTASVNTAGAGLSNINLSAGTASNNLSNFVFSNSNGISFGLNGSTITGTVATNYQSQGAYLTTAMLSNAVTLSNAKFSAGTLSSLRSDITFNNSNGISFGLETNGVITGTVATNYQAPGAYLTTAMLSNAVTISNINVSGGTTSNNLSNIVFSNSNGISFGLNGSTLTGTVATNYQSQGAYLTTAMLSNAATISNVNLSAGTTSNNLSAFVFSNSNGISFGLDGSTVTGTVKTDYLTTAMLSNAATISNINVSAGTTSNNLSAVVFSNSNNVSFGLNGSTITATITVPSQTNQSVGLYALGNTTQNSSTTLDARSLSFNGLGIITAGYSNGSIQLSATQSKQDLSLYALGNTTQNSSTVLNASVISYNGLGIVTVGYSNGSIQISATQSNQAFSAAGGSSNFQTLSFADTNSVSWTNTNGSIGIASVKLQMYAVSNTTQSSTGTANHTAISFAGAGVASVGITNGSVVVSVPSGGGGLSNINLSAGTTSNNLSNFVMSNSNNATFGLNGSTVTVSSPISFSAGTTNNNFTNIVFSNSNNATFGLNGSTITVSAPLKISAGTLSAQLTDITFSNSNGISFGLNGSTITASCSGERTFSRYDPWPFITGTGTSSHAPASWYFAGVFVPYNLAFSNINILKSISVGVPGATSQASTGTNRFSYSNGITIFTRQDYGANSTNLSYLTTASFGLTAGLSYSSTSQSFVMSWVTDTTGGTSSYNTTSSNAAWSNFLHGNRFLKMPCLTTLTAGEYFIANRHSSTRGTTGSNINLFAISNFICSNQLIQLNFLGSSGSNNTFDFFGGIGSGFASAVTTNATMAASVISTTNIGRWIFNMSNV